MSMLVGVAQVFNRADSSANHVCGAKGLRLVCRTVRLSYRQSWDLRARISTETTTYWGPDVEVQGLLNIGYSPLL